MIEIHVGGLGSAKTASVVWQMLHDKSNRIYFSNIKTKLKNNILITPEMIINREQLFTDKGKPVISKGRKAFNYTLNVEYWQNDKRPKNIVLDEAHTLLNPRRSSSKINVLMTDWVALLRRVVGQDSRSTGKLILISQLPNRLDWIVRDLASAVIYHRCHYVKTCLKCKLKFHENTDRAELLETCPRCGHWEMEKSNFLAECIRFPSIDKFYEWQILHKKTFIRKYAIKKIADVFPLYNTLQWDNMMSEMY